MFFSMTTITYMTGHPGLPADIDDKLNSRELHGGWSWVEERVVLSWVANLGNKMLAMATCCLANLDGWLCVCLRVPSPPRPPVHTQREREGSPLFHVTEQVPPGPGQEFFRTPFVLRLKYLFIFDKEKKFILSKIHLVSSYSRELIDSRVDEKAFEAGHPKSHHGLGDVRCIFPLTTVPRLPLYNTEKALGKPYKSHLKKIMLLKHILFDWLNIFGYFLGKAWKPCFTFLLPWDGERCQGWLRPRSPHPPSTDLGLQPPVCFHLEFALV